MSQPQVPPSVFQSFMPCMWLGGYSLLYGPNAINFDQEATVAVHPVLGSQEQTEAVGWTAHKVQFNGFVYGVSNTSGPIPSGPAADFGSFLNSNAPGVPASTRINRPTAVGFFTQNSSFPNSSELLYSDVVYVTSWHLEYRGGYPVYKYPFRFAFIEAKPVTLVAGTTTDGKLWSFNMSGLGPGYVAAVNVLGQGIAVSTGGQPQSILTIIDNTSTIVGNGPQLGTGTGLLSSGFNPQAFYTQGANQGTLFWPIIDTLSRWSVLSPNVTGTWTVNFQTAFTAYSAVKLAFVPA